MSRSIHFSIPSWAAIFPPRLSGSLTFRELQETMRGYRASRVLLTAVELDVFTAVGEGATSTEVAATLATHPRATESLLNALVALGALTKRADTFQNTPATARYLVAGSPECVRPGFLHSVNRWHTWATLSDCVRTGTCVLEPGIEQQEGNWTRAFIASTTPQAARGSAELVRALKSKNIRRMLDLGGGSGICSIALARAKPALRAEVFDLPIVVPLAQERIRRAGLEGRITTRSGDLRTDEFGSGYDLILVSAVCHLFGPDQNLDLLRRCYGALSPGGTLAIRDLILNSNRTSPAVAALFSLQMLVATRAGSTYTEEEFKTWLGNAGFQNVTRSRRCREMILATKVAASS